MGLTESLKGVREQVEDFHILHVFFVAPMQQRKGSRRRSLVRWLAGARTFAVSNASGL